jgi:hypothetical protein
MARIILPARFGGKSEKIPADQLVGIILRDWCRSQSLSFTTEHKFHAGRQWKFDWAIVELKIAVEYEGGMFGKPKARRCPVCKELPKVSHFAIDRIIRDAEKYNQAAVDGWCVIRVIPTMVDVKQGTCDKVMEVVEKAVESRRRKR